MPKYTVRFSKENGGKYYQTILEAKNEQEAFVKARVEATNKGVELPDEVWTRILRHKGT